jgi:hypothetical protein
MLAISISYIINILVAGIMGIILFFDIGTRPQKVFGENTSGRQILACLYLSIAVFSIWGIISQEYFTKIAFILFSFQILYKLLTLIAVKDKKNPVPYANLLISMMHTYSIWYIFTNGLI